MASIIRLALVRMFAPLLSMPVSLMLHYTNVVVPAWIFVAGLVAIAVLADWVRCGTEQVAAHAGGAIGSLLNVSFGNAAFYVLVTHRSIFTSGGRIGQGGKESGHGRSGDSPIASKSPSA